MAPTSSTNTPTLLMVASNFTPTAFTTVLNVINTQPSRTAFRAASRRLPDWPMIWKLEEI